MIENNKILTPIILAYCLGIFKKGTTEELIYLRNKLNLSIKKKKEFKRINEYYSKIDKKKF